MSKTTELALVGTATSPTVIEHVDVDPMTSPAAYRHAMELATTLAQSQLIPKNFYGKPADVFMSMLLARRMGEDVFTILQNVHFVGNKPGWSASFMIARANQSGIFSTPLTWETTGEGDDMAVTCSATLAQTGQVVSRSASMRMARTEGWTKNPKYNQHGLAEQMLHYRSSSLLLRLYAPQVMLGLHTEDEWQDVAAARGEPVTYTDPTPPAPTPRPRRGSPEPTPPLVAVDVPSDVPSGRDGLGEAPEAPAAPDPDRAALLERLAVFRANCPDLLRAEAKHLGHSSPAKATTDGLRAIVAAVDARIALAPLTDEELFARLALAEHAASAHIGPEETAALGVAAGLPVGPGGVVTDGAPRAMVERWLAALEWAVQP